MTRPAEHTKRRVHASLCPLALALGLSALSACRGPGAVAAHTAQPEASTPITPAAPPEPLLPETMDTIPSGFVETSFGGEGLATIEPRRILLEPGVPLSGVTYTGALPAAPYVLELEFTKRYGNDFPCALTFPVAGAHLSLVLGGWGGAVSGLSSLDGLDASQNSTRFVRSFPPGARTCVRVDVNDHEVRVALDGQQVLQVDLTGRRIGVRAELLPSRPLGLAAFATAVEFHSVRWRSADDHHLAPPPRPAPAP